MKKQNPRKQFKSDNQIDQSSSLEHDHNQDNQHDNDNLDPKPQIVHIPSARVELPGIDVTFKDIEIVLWKNWYWHAKSNTPPNTPRQSS